MMPDLAYINGPNFAKMKPDYFSLIDPINQTFFIFSDFSFSHSAMCFPFSLHLKRRDEKEAQCLKITEKVSFNIASEASYVYIGVD